MTIPREQPQRATEIRIFRPLDRYMAPTPLQK